MSFTPFIAVTQILVQGSFGFPVAPDMAVNGLKADGEFVFFFQKIRHLLRAQLLPEQALHPSVLLVAMASASAASPQLSIAALLGFARTIGLAFACVSGRTVTRDLAVNGTAVSAHNFTDVRHAVTSNAKHRDGVSFTIGELVVRHKDSFLVG